MLTHHINHVSPFPATPAVKKGAAADAEPFAAALAAASSEGPSAAAPVKGGLAGGDSLLAAQQTDDDDSGVPIGIRHWMEDIAKDPAIAEKAASDWAGGTPVVFTNITEGPKNGDPAEVWVEFSRKMDAKMDLARKGQQDLKSLYESESAKGTPPAQIYAHMLKLQLSQSQAYLDTQGPSATIRASLQGQLDYLQKVMAG